MTLQEFWRRIMPPGEPVAVAQLSPLDRAVERLRAVEAADKLRIDMTDTLAMLNAIAATRLHSSTANDETLNQLIIIKERVNILGEKLEALIVLATPAILATPEKAT